MPTAAASRTSCRNPRGQTRASQSADQAQAPDGNPRSFSIGWPPRFESRTCNPADPCYVGRRSADRPNNKPAESQQPGGSPPKWIDPIGARVKAGTKPWLFYRLLVKRGGPMTAGEISMHLNCPTVQVFSTAKRLIAGEAIKARRVKGGFEYSLGPIPLVEV